MLASSTAGPMARRKGQNADSRTMQSLRCGTHKILGADPRNSAHRSAVLMNISRSWTALAHHLESLAILAKSEGK